MEIHSNYQKVPEQTEAPPPAQTDTATDHKVDRLEALFDDLDQMMGTMTEGDIERFLDLLQSVRILLGQEFAKRDRLETLDQAEELADKVAELKHSFEDVTLLVLTVTSALFQAGGGVVGGSALLLGTGPGNAIGTLVPAFQITETHTLENALQQVSQFSNLFSSLGSAGQNLSKLPENIDQSDRAVLQAAMKRIELRQNDRLEAAKSARQARDAASQQWRQSIEAGYQAKNKVIS